jgi:hypothetical protein
MGRAYGKSQDWPGVIRADLPEATEMGVLDVEIEEIAGQEESVGFESGYISAWSATVP